MFIIVLPLITLILLDFKPLHLNASLYHVEKVLSEVEEHKWCPLDQLHIDIVVGGGATDLISLSLASRVVGFTVCST